MYRQSDGYVYLSNANRSQVADIRFFFGDPGDVPLAGDFDGDGVDTVGLHRESTGLVYFNNQHRAQAADHQFVFGDPGDRIVAGDWNGDGADSPALFRPADATFYFRHTNTQGVADAQLTFGQPSWVPPGSAPAALAPPPTTTTTTTPAGLGPDCHPSYIPCVPYAPDVDCLGGSGDGPVYTGRVTVVGPDVYDLDRDGDGIGCQSS